MLQWTDCLGNRWCLFGSAGENPVGQYGKKNFRLCARIQRNIYWKGLETNIIHQWAGNALMTYLYVWLGEFILCIGIAVYLELHPFFESESLTQISPGLIFIPLWQCLAPILASVSYQLSPDEYFHATAYRNLEPLLSGLPINHTGRILKCSSTRSGCFVSTGGVLWNCLRSVPKMPPAVYFPLSTVFHLLRSRK